MHRFCFVFILIVLFAGCKPHHKPAIVFQTDFGLKDGAVSVMKGVAMDIDPTLTLFDLTHEIPAYNVWEAAYRLYQTAPYWPKGTVFVSVVDPGVGGERLSIVMKSRSGHYFVGPDNGTFTLVAEALGIDAVHQIDEAINRRKETNRSYTFHGRDVYAYTAARLAAGKISFEEVGKKLPDTIYKLNYQKPVFENGVIKGNIPVLDVQYGNVWTNIHDTIFSKLQISEQQKIDVGIFYKDSLVYRGLVQYVNTFDAVPVNNSLAYLNSLMNFSLALNMNSFADSFKIQSGQYWNIELRKAPGHE